mmetsp:Transcript_22325/g.52591  ORF Transcript_22325/g.52591 Transcript_22325/m.52591 type:complete len:598 (+) Transcript_22325:101-1894(+)
MATSTSTSASTMVSLNETKRPSSFQSSSNKMTKLYSSVDSKWMFLLFVLCASVVVVITVEMNLISSGVVASETTPAIDSAKPLSTDERKRTRSGTTSTSTPTDSNNNNNNRGKKPEHKQEDEFVGRIPNRRRKQRPKRDDNSNNSTKITTKDVATNTSSTVDNDRWTFEETALMDPNLTHAEFYDSVSKVAGPLSSKNLWDKGYDEEATNGLPRWVKRYMNWHRWKRQNWDLDNWQNERWMILQCIRTQDKKKCGGTADRLKPVPTLLKLAYETRRILLIHWDRPCLLEEFLIPPEGGLDWRTPGPIVDVLADASNGKRLQPYKMISKYAYSGMSLVRTRYQTHFPESKYDDLVVDDEVNEPPFNVTFHKTWRMMFTPSIALRNVLKSKMDEMGLVPNKYVASHLRALYNTVAEDRSIDLIKKFTSNALDCATELRPGLPIYFASDSSDATSYALKIGHPARALTYNGSPGSSGSHSKNKINVDTNLQPRIVASIPSQNPPWHLDKYIGPPENFFDTFIDLYLMAEARCVTFSRGGFGSWALLIGGNIDCFSQQDIIGSHGTKLEYPCKADPSMTPNTKLEATRTVVEPLYLPPMKD